MKMIVRAPSSSTRSLREPLDGLGEGARLLVLADRHELGGGARVVDAHDVLLDDRALVEVARHEMRRRADELHAAGVRLLVRVGALEPGQERVVDVDDPPAERGAQLGREDLHVPREHDELDVVLLDHLEHAVFEGELLARRSSPGATRTARRRTTASSARSGWLLSTSGMSTDSWPARWRYSRSLRQWAAVETSTRVRRGRPTTSSCHVIP